ncbi:BMP family ABC transporter substrate-binding protein [Bacillus sp. AK031]
MKKKIYVVLLLLLSLAGCAQQGDNGSLQKAGLLVPETVSDQVWGTKGYKGLLKIQSEFGVDVYYKEGMASEDAIKRAVAEYESKGVNLIFGHGQEYAPIFNELSNEYPEIHFVSFNGNAINSNTTSVNFEAYAMGFFGGMTAAHQTQTDNIGIVAAFAWQPEVKGFIEGARYQDTDVKVHVDYTNDWNNNEAAMVLLYRQLKKQVDVVYPAGDGYNVSIIEELKERGLFAIGFVSDQSDMGESTVLTSTVQHVDKLYKLIADRYSKGDLKAGNIHFDFQDGVISMGRFSPLVDQKFREDIEKDIDHYIKTGELPNERKE